MDDDNRDTRTTRALKRTAPPLSVAEDGTTAEITLEDQQQLKRLFGTKTSDAAEQILRAGLNSLGAAGASYMDLVSLMVLEMEPRDAVEAMLVSQMTATHLAMSATSRKVADATSYQIRESYERSLTRLSRTFLAQMEALKKYRAKAQQVVRVERVTVNDGGQAIVGSVDRGGRDG